MLDARLIDCAGYSVPVGTPSTQKRVVERSEQGGLQAGLL